MPDILYFSRNRSTNIQQEDDYTIKSTCRLTDTLTEAIVEIIVKLPDLEIIDIKGEVKRSHIKECLLPATYLKKAVGIRIGSGMLKIIKGLVGDETNCKQLSFMLEECCHAIILSFTKETLQKVPPNEAGTNEYYSRMVKENIRLYNRCAAFAPGSAIVEGINPP